MKSGYAGRTSSLLRCLCLLCVGLWLAVLGGCARQSIVLVPDPDGRVGKAEVSTVAGTQRLEKAGDMTRVRDNATPPSEVTTADPVFINKTFGEALAIEPPPADVFTLFFENGSSGLTADSQNLLAAVVKAAQRPQTISVSVSGHTDATGSARLNDELARARAEAVKTLLVEQGVGADLISVSSHGKGNPAFPTPEGVPEPRNRRVVVIIH